MKKYLYILIFCFVSAQLSSQGIVQEKSYYLEIPDPDNVPTVIKYKEYIRLDFRNIELTRLFGNYTVRDFKMAFPEADSELLEKVYVISCDPELIDKVATKEYRAYFGHYKEIVPLQMLYIPNDLGGTKAGAVMEQSELGFIRAPEAWDIAKGDGVLIGIAEDVNTEHEDLIGKSAAVNGEDPDAFYVGHGTRVALVAGAGTDNGTGAASVGYNVRILAGDGYDKLIPLANNGVRVINMSWGSCNEIPVDYEYEQEIIDEVWKKGVVLVAAAGNGEHSCLLGPDADHYPASLNHVISVTSVGHQFDSETVGTEPKHWKDVHLNPDPPYNSTHNINIDLSAPGRNIVTAKEGFYAKGNAAYVYDGGTSFAAPLVTGTIGLMFSVNPCLFPDEVESILKLTAYKNDTIPENLPYIGKLGAGRLDTYMAVKMARDMQLPDGTVEVKNRIIDRWDFNLRTAPYKIEMTDNTMTGSARLDFTAKKAITVLSGDYKPDNSGLADLKIKAVNHICNTPGHIKKNTRRTLTVINRDNGGVINLHPNPNNGIFTIRLANTNKEEVTVTVYDLYGKKVYRTLQRESGFEVNISGLAAGVYIATVQGNQYNETVKFVKQ